MAKTTNTTSSNAADREALKAALRNDIMAALSGPKTSASITDRLLNWSADKLSDAGNGVAELAAGASAAVDNFSVTYASAKLRQQARTQAKIDALIERRLQLEGL